MTDPGRPRVSSEAPHRPASIRSMPRNSPSPSPQPPPSSGPASRPGSSRHASTEHAQRPIPNLPDESTIKARQPPRIQPLFTLVSDTTSRGGAPPRTHHPRVHYIFSDDDPDLLTRTLAAQHQSLAAAEAGSDAGVAHPPPATGSGERTVLLDLVPREDGPGYDVAWASSLSPDWAVTGARVTQMSGGSAAGVAAASSSDDEVLMLRIEGLSVEGAGSSGVAAPQPAVGQASGGKAPSPEADMQSSGASGNRGPAATADNYGALIDEFEKRMGLLRKVVDTSEERQRKMAAAESVEEEEDETQRPEEGDLDNQQSGGGD